ncbi:MAG: glycosyltransferase 87 family protein [Armatimonadota bacterium]
MRRELGRPLIAAGSGLAICAALWVGGSPAPGEVWARPFLRGYAIAWVCYVLACTAIGRIRVLPRWAMALVVVLAIAMRLIAIERIHPLSTDAYRYLWDGRVANAGTNPYTYPPSAAKLRALRDDNWRRISFRHVPTIYPPAAQLVFGRLAAVGAPEIEAFRWAFAAFDIGTILVLMALLRRTDSPPERVVWYAWCPLAITETAAGAHVDALALFLLALALVFASREGKTSAIPAGVALAGAVMTKGLAVLVLPLLAKRGGWRLMVAFVLTCAAIVAPYASAGSRLFDGLRAYMVLWKANASIFLVLDGLLGRATESHFPIARAVTGAAILLVVAILAWRLRPGLRPLVRSVFMSFGALLSLGAPTLPWYALWVVPALCWWAVPGLALFTFTVSAQYYARWLHPGDRAAHYALLWAGYLPVYALLIGQAIWWAAKRRSATGGSA